MKVSKRSLLVGAAAVTAFAMGVVLFVPAAGADDDAEYKGNKSCKKCHSKTYKSWEETVHGTALDSLKPSESADVKTASGLDPAKDYTTDASCLACHAVGHGKTFCHSDDLAGPELFSVGRIDGNNLIFPARKQGIAR